MPSSELEKALAKRRSRDEDVFENSAVQSSADARMPAAASSSLPRESMDQPPWLEDAVFVESAAEPSADFASSEDGLPPWFNAAVESGIVFYDPDGEEVVVPCSKVGAFKAALETVIEFEPEPCRGSLPVAAAVGTATGASAGYSTGSSAPCAPSKTNVAAEASLSAEDAEALRRELKANLQKRYFALLRSGLEPNEAAARAILEAAGHSGGAAPQEVQKSRSCAQSDVSADLDASSEIAVVA